MKIPQNVRIGGVDYQICRKEYLHADGKVLYGQIDYDDCEIRLSETEGLAFDHQCITLMHEILHGIIENYQIELDDEEKVVEALARGLFQVIKDNEQELFS